MDKARVNSDADKDLAAVLEILPRLPRKALQIVRAKTGELDTAKALEERREAKREIQRIAKEHGIRLGNIGEPKRRPGRPAKPKGGAGG